MVPCRALTIDDEVETFFISRAYNPNQVFIYIKDVYRNEVYLENLSTNVGTVHERYDFSNVET